MSVLLRWLAVPIGAVAVWILTLALGFAALSLLDALCPPELVESGMCTAPWHTPAVEALILSCTAIVSFGVVLVPALIAPAHRLPVALVAYACGAAFAVSATRAPELTGPFLVSALGGSAALWRVSRWQRRTRAAAPAV